MNLSLDIINVSTFDNKLIDFLHCWIFSFFFHFASRTTSYLAKNKAQA